MSTRSNIAIERANGEIAYIYAHNDGYPSHNGRILRDHYSDRETVESLIALGNISILGPRLDPEGSAHSFDSPEKGTVLAYARDRGEKKQEAGIGSSRDAIVPLCEVDYTYLFTTEGKWTVAGLGRVWEPLEKVLSWYKYGDTVRF